MRYLIIILASWMLVGCAATTSKKLNEVSFDIKAGESVIFIGAQEKLLASFTPPIKVHINNNDVGTLSSGEILKYLVNTELNQITANVPIPNRCYVPEEAILKINPNQKKFLVIDKMYLSPGATLMCAQVGFKITEVSEDQFLKVFR